MSDCPTCSKRSLRRNGLVSVPNAWLAAVFSSYVKGGGSVYVKWTDLPYATPGSRIHKGLSKLYPDGVVKLRIKVGGLPASTLGAVAYPQAGGSITASFQPGLKRAKRTIHHELRHAVQHLGDMALRASMSKKEAARVKASPKGKLSGRFGRPKPSTVKALRGWKSEVKAGKKKGTQAAWYYRSPSEYQPHVGDAASAVLEKLPNDPTDKQVRARIRHVVASRPIFQYLSEAELRDALRSLYGAVRNTLDAT
jgi:hypothetical protein